MDLKPIRYTADGFEMTGWLADGSGGKSAPGIVVAHEANGLGDNVKDRVRRLAERGYVALASDLYGREIGLDEMMALHQHLMTTPGLMLSRARAALDALAAQPHVDTHRLAAIGFCQGGIVALELARSRAPIRAAIGFHPGFARPAGSASGPIEAKVLMMIGSDDPLIDPVERTAFVEEMRAAGADWQLHVFGGVVHSFTSPQASTMGISGLAYDPNADRRSWTMMLNLFEEIF